jgi:hypothetical protein
MTLRYALLAILLHAGLIWSADALLFEKGTQLPWLRVDGKVITDSTGRPVRLVGHGISRRMEQEINSKNSCPAQSQRAQLHAGGVLPQQRL